MMKGPFEIASFTVGSNGSYLNLLDFTKLNLNLQSDKFLGGNTILH